MLRVQLRMQEHVIVVGTPSGFVIRHQAIKLARFFLSQRAVTQPAQQAIQFIVKAFANHRSPSTASVRSMHSYRARRMRFSAL